MSSADVATERPPITGGVWLLTIVVWPLTGLLGGTGLLALMSEVTADPFFGEMSFRAVLLVCVLICAPLTAATALTRPGGSPRRAAGLTCLASLLMIAWIIPLLFGVMAYLCGGSGSCTID